jgi:hypothetical protein
MWFKRRPRPPTRTDRWAAFAAATDAKPIDGASERLRRFLDLHDGELRHLHVWRRPGAPSLHMFDLVRVRTGPAGSHVTWSTWGLVQSRSALVGASFRAAPRRDPVIESLEASRSGASPVRFPARPEVDAALAVLARDPLEVRGLLTAPVLDLLVSLTAVSPSARIIAAEHHVVGHVDVAEGDDPAAFLAFGEGLIVLATVLQPAVAPRIAGDDFLDLA